MPVAPTQHLVLAPQQIKAPTIDGGADKVQAVVGDSKV